VVSRPRAWLQIPFDFPVESSPVSIPIICPKANVEDGRTVLKLAQQLPAGRRIVNVV
jgi:hypothetical protein